MLTPGKVSAVLSRARGPQTPAPSPCTPSPACRGTLLERKTTCHGCSPFQDHLVLETIPDFRIILGLENAASSQASSRQRRLSSRRGLGIELKDMPLETGHSRLERPRERGGCPAVSSLCSEPPPCSLRDKRSSWICRSAWRPCQRSAEEESSDFQQVSWSGVITY